MAPEGGAVARVAPVYTRHIKEILNALNSKGRCTGVYLLACGCSGDCDACTVVCVACVCAVRV